MPALFWVGDYFGDTFRYLFTLADIQKMWSDMAPRLMLLTCVKGLNFFHLLDFKTVIAKERSIVLSDPFGSTAFREDGTCEIAKDLTTLNARFEILLQRCLDANAVPGIVAGMNC